MQNLIKTMKGSSKKQLQQVLSTKQKSESELSDYLKEGQSYLKTIDSKLGLDGDKTIFDAKSTSTNSTEPAVKQALIDKS